MNKMEAVCTLETHDLVVLLLLFSDSLVTCGAILIGFKGSVNLVVMLVNARLLVAVVALNLLQI